MTTTTDATPDAVAQSRAAWIRAFAIGAGMALVGCIMATAFLLPLTHTNPKDIALGVAGPEQATTALTQRFDEQRPGVFDTTSYSTREEAVEAVKSRDVSGAVVVGADGTEFLTASAGAAQVSQMLTQMADGMGAQPGANVTVTDVVPGGKNATAINMTVIAALIPGLAGSMVGFMAVKKAYRRFALLFGAGVTSGLLAALILGPVFNVLEGAYWADALALGMATMAIGGIITGLGALFGGAGLGVGALIILLFANPWSGNMAPKEFLPSPWGTWGSWLPNGTLIDLLRVLSYFPDAGTAGHWWRLIGWIAFGFVCLGVGSYLQPKKEARKAAKKAAAEAAEAAETQAPVEA
jgi:hypothetical protein